MKFYEILYECERIEEFLKRSLRTYEKLNSGPLSLRRKELCEEILMITRKLEKLRENSEKYLEEEKKSEKVQAKCNR